MAEIGPGTGMLGPFARGIETYLHADCSHNLLLLQCLESSHFSGLAGNEPCGCRKVVQI